jgi:hypothetical protein
VCFVVLGRNVPGLEAIATLMADAPALEPPVHLYQRLLARDDADAWGLVEEHLAAQPPETVFDGLLLPSLNYAERDRLSGHLAVEDERDVVRATRELVHDAVGVVREQWPPANDGRRRERVAGFAVEADADELALEMLSALLEPAGIAIELAPARLMPSELISFLQTGRYRTVCIADLPPSASSKARYLVRKLRAALPELAIVVGRWAPPELADEGFQSILDAGATRVAQTLIETRDQLAALGAEAASTDAAPLAPIARASGDRAGGA